MFLRVGLSGEIAESAVLAELACAVRTLAELVVSVTIPLCAGRGK